MIGKVKLTQPFSFPGQSKVEFCHDYQNRGKCSRNNCKFIHCKREEEEEFKSTGYLPPHVRDQVGPGSVPSNLNSRPIYIHRDFVLLVGTVGNWYYKPYNSTTVKL